MSDPYPYESLESLALPQDPDAERALLSTMAFCPEHPEVDQILGLLEHGDGFLITAHRHIYQAFYRMVMANEDVNSLTLKAELEKQGTLDKVGGFTSLVEILSGEEVLHPMVLAKRVHDLHHRRLMMRAATKLLQRAGDTSIPSDELLRDLQASALSAKASTGLLNQTSFGVFLETPPEATDWLIPGVLQRGAPGIFAAQPGAGKSYQCLQMMVCVATGKAFMGYPNGLPPRLAIYLSLEDPRVVVHRRLRSVVELYKARGEWTEVDEANLANNAVLLTPNWDGPGATTAITRLVPHIEAVLEQLRDVEPGILVIDTLAQATDGDENSAKDMKPIMGACFKLAERHNLTVLVTHHVAKGQTSARSTEKRTLDELMSPEWLRGSGAILGAVRFIAQLAPLRADQAEKVNLGLDMDKARKGGYCVWGVSKQSIGPVPDWRLLERVEYGDPGSGCWQVHPHSLDILAALKGGKAKEELTKQDSLLVALFEYRMKGIEADRKDLCGRFYSTTRNPDVGLRNGIAKLRNAGLVQKANMDLTVTGYERARDLNQGYGLGDTQ